MRIRSHSTEKQRILTRQQDMFYYMIFFREYTSHALLYILDYLEDKSVPRYFKIISLN